MRTALFITCFNDTMRPATGRAVVTLLERLGCTVDFPLGQTCCGQMHFNTGYQRDCVPLVRRFGEVFADYDAVVAPSGSCAAMIRHHHKRVAEVAGDRELQQAVRTAPPVYELSEFLVDVLEVTDVGAYFPHRVTYHPTCHSSRMLGVGDRPLALLRAVRGIDLVELPDAAQCCGFGGTFALKNSDTSVAMGADKVRGVLESRAEVLCAGDNSCLMHVGGLLSRLRTGVRTMHLAEILAAGEHSAAQRVGAGDPQYARVTDAAATAGRSPR
ncbi:(Fe-S)-binding protein [Streptomyces spirodelae]|uniref:(Fe-S)-binding protein n=1 Tax=Streptomyces spirodelae TaxID=2812904 RepID=A0ABS3WTS9_9ACTN|nr:(Fe-S)-binding protein [Streptomyces spirodelae]MBO8186444.1 (Fe-S)-binding protein [Streptomyces spirodelae]